MNRYVRNTGIATLVLITALAATTITSYLVGRYQSKASEQATLSQPTSLSTVLSEAVSPVDSLVYNNLDNTILLTEKWQGNNIEGMADGATVTDNSVWRVGYKGFNDSKRDSFLRADIENYQTQDKDRTRTYDLKLGDVSDDEQNSAIALAAGLQSPVVSIRYHISDGSIHMTEKWPGSCIEGVVNSTTTIDYSIWHPVPGDGNNVRYTLAETRRSFDFPNACKFR